MTDRLRLQLELGPKGKRVVAVAQDWPGLSRGAKTEDGAVEKLVSYVPRYADVAHRAGLEAEFAAVTGDDIDIVERYPGSGSTDFWGISFAYSSLDHQPLTDRELERHLTLLRACWAVFDETGARVSPELQKGPRGGGRDRDHIIRHTLAAELDMCWKVGIQRSLDDLLTPDGLAGYRDAYCDAIREYHSEGKPARKWPLRYVIRHTAFHTMDHAWEMVDKDLTAQPDGVAGD